MDQPNISPEVKAQIAETLALRAAVADVTLAWGGVENMLASLFAAYIGEDKQELAFAVYFAPSNTENRLSMVKAAVESGPKARTPEESLFRECFAKVHERVRAVKQKRDRVAHGEITTHVNAKTGKHHVRLGPPLYDPRSASGAFPHGMGIDEVKQIAGKIGITLQQISVLANVRRNIERRRTPDPALARHVAPESKDREALGALYGELFLSKPPAP